MGFLQYLAPSISLVIAVFLYDEPFTQTHAITFALIWSALALVSGEAIRRDRSARAAQRVESASPVISSNTP